MDSVGVITNPSGATAAGLSGTGPGVNAALAQPVNGASGLVTVNSSGYSAPNVTQTKSNFLYVGWSGRNAATGATIQIEREYLLYSSDGLTWSQIHGLENYVPSNPNWGFRDGMITKIGTKYYIAGALDESGVFPGFEVISSSDLIKWSFVSDVTGTHVPTTPKWFQDPTTGKIYGVGYQYLIENTSKDGVTWGTPVQFTLSGGGGVPFTGDQFLLYKTGTYYLFSSVGNTYHIYTSSSISSGYTDQGVITGWPASAEGLCVFLDNTGTYRAYFTDLTSSVVGTAYSTSTTLAIGAWSAPVGLGSAANNPASNPNFGGGALGDDGGGYCFNDDDTLRDVIGAMAQYNTLLQNIPGTPPGFTFKSGLNFNSTIPNKPGTGTITWAGTNAGLQGTVTGTNTLFTHELQVGSVITSANGNYGTVVGGSSSSGTISSDTQVFVTCNSSGGLGTAQTFTINPPILTASVTTNTPKTFINGGQTTGNGALTFFGPLACNWYDPGVTTSWFAVKLNGGWSLQDVAFSSFPIVVDSNVATKTVYASSTGLSSVGNITAAKNFIATNSNGVTATVPAVVATLSINAKTVANTLLYTVPAGKTFTPMGVIIRCTAASAITNGPTIDISTTAGGGGNIYASTNIAALQTVLQTYTFGIFGMSTAVAAAGTVYLDLTAAATGTSQTIQADLLGILE